MIPRRLQLGLLTTEYLIEILPPGQTEARAFVHMYDTVLLYVYKIVYHTVRRMTRRTDASSLVDLQSSNSKFKSYCCRSVAVAPQFRKEIVRRAL
jgi:hypothetical protein